MATTDDGDEVEQCRALIDDGERCSRPAQEDGFCYQHDESDPTVDEQTTTDGGSADSAEADGSDVGDDDTEEVVERADAGDSGRNDVDADGEESDGRGAGQPLSTESNLDDVPDIVAVRRTVQNTAEALIGRPLDGVMEVSPQEDGWRVLVEVVERAAVPDTQDILGKYEIDVTDDLDVIGYRRLERYRRTDTGQSQ